MKFYLIAFVATFFIFLTACTSTKKMTAFHPEESIDEKLKQSDLLVRQNSDKAALKVLDEILEKDPNNAFALSRKGAIFYNNYQKEEAFEFLSKAVQEDKTQDKDILYSAFIAANEVENYEAAIDFGESLQRTIGLSSERQKRLNDLLAKNRLRKQFMEQAQKIELHPLPPSVNTLNSEYLPRVSLDDNKLFFVRKEGQNEVIYVTDKTEDHDWSGPALPHEAWKALPSAGAFSISEDQTKAVITICNSPSGFGACDLYLSKRTADSWTVPSNLGDVINSASWDSQPCFSADGNRIYFSSDRKGGFGGRDIWVINIINHTWQEPINLGPKINSAGNDESPFIHADGQTLYFRSDGWPGLGSYDNFITKLDYKGEAYIEPTNMGFPINTSGNDGAFALGPDGKTAYIATDHFSKERGVRSNLDIITFQLPEEFRSLPTTYLLLEILDIVTGQRVAADFEIIDLDKNQVITRNTHFPSISSPIPITSGTNLGLFINKPGYLPYSEHFMPETSRDASQPYQLQVKLSLLNDKKPVVLRNIFFDTNSSTLKESSYTELGKLVSLLTEQKKLKIKILGHTDNVGSNDNNLRLSEARAKSVYEYLINHGIPSTRLSYEGVGEMSPIASNDSEEGRLLNRRTEFVVEEL